MATKYIKAYIKICYNAKKENRKKNKDTYYEKHHIKPKSLGGSDYKSNLVLLTGREHYITHFLLYKHYKSINNKNGIIKMGYSFFRMCQITQNNDVRYKSKNYEIAKNAVANSNKLLNTGKLKPESIEIARKMGLANKGKPAWNKGLPSPQRKIVCPYCNKEGGAANMRRYHFNNCKFIS